MRLEDYFRGLSDATRLRILNLLFHNELCGCDFQHLLEIAQPVVSRHLLYLKRSGLVEDRRDGFRVFYRLMETKALKQLFDFLRQAFHGQEVFIRDLTLLRQVMAEGKLPSRAGRSLAPGNERRGRGRRRMLGLGEGRGRRAVG
jgi:ArsR family transcriptional regulator, arsenate/arsenite/antimonite-responsive transcriptional repressor